MEETTKRGRKSKMHKGRTIFRSRKKKACREGRGANADRGSCSLSNIFLCDFKKIQVKEESAALEFPGEAQTHIHCCEVLAEEFDASLEPCREAVSAGKGETAARKQGIASGKAAVGREGVIPVV